MLTLVLIVIGVAALVLIALLGVGLGMSITERSAAEQYFDARIEINKTVHHAKQAMDEVAAITVNEITPAPPKAAPRRKALEDGAWRIQ